MFSIKAIFYKDIVTLITFRVFLLLSNGDVRFAKNVSAQKNAKPIQFVADNLPNYDLPNYLLILSFWQILQKTHKMPKQLKYDYGISWVVCNICQIDRLNFGIF